MPKQVWQVEDGGIFENEEDAIAWEKSQQVIDNISDHLYHNTCGIAESYIREVVEVLLVHYTVTPK